MSRRVKPVSGVGEAALAYCRRGWSIVPMHSPADGGCSCERRGCVAVGKHPRVSVRSETGLSHELGEAGNPPERIEATATVSFVPGEGVKSSHIVVQGRVPGIDQSGFESAARNAGENCPISGALKGNVEITVEATLQL